MKVVIIGVGLIGGSFAKDVKKLHPEVEIIKLKWRPVVGTAHRVSVVFPRKCVAFLASIPPYLLDA